MTPRAVVIHGHFYQPPRENPWLEAVEVQDSAAPHHDWNERVTAECYAPNTAARRVDDQNRIVDIVNNFEKISFDVGPTLMAWLAVHRPDVHARIVEADRASVRARGGHGNAMAQAYNHLILPLATRRDKVTQVRWGLADFRMRFGREAEGMWLPETAVDGQSLEVLAEAGLRFTVLAPHQARRIRRIGTEAWEAVGERIDPTRSYLWRGPGGQSLALFFYDGSVSRAIAFGDALARSERLVDLLRGAFSEARSWPEVVHCATDGESYGHHKTFGEMALAAALHRIEQVGFAALTNYGAFLAAHPPTHEVQIAEPTSWSCAHGVERWRSDCGCRMRADTQQRWRRPLREALDWARDQIDALYEARASACLKDPWEARDAYIDVILDRQAERIAAWLAAHARGPLDGAARVEALRLLEMQRNRLLMYTSCGWFFDEVSGLEATQVLKYAARAIQYLQDLGGPALEPGLVRRLEAAPSNVATSRDAGNVYQQVVRPATVDLRRVVARHAIGSLAEDRAAAWPGPAWRVEQRDEVQDAHDHAAIRIGRVLVTMVLTGEAREALYAVLHFGGPDVSCGVGAWEDATSYEAMKTDLLHRWEQLSMADVVRGFDTYFPRDVYGLQHLFLDVRRQVLAAVTREAIDRCEDALFRIWEENRKLVRYLVEVEAPVPEALRLAGQHALQRMARAELGRVETLGVVPDRLLELVAEGRGLRLAIDLTPALPVLERTLHGALDTIRRRPAEDTVAAAARLLEGASRLGVKPGGLWHAQNDVFALWQNQPESRRVLAPLMAVLGFSLTEEAP